MDRSILEDIVDAGVEPDSVAEGGVETVGEFQREDEVLVPGQLESQSRGGGQSLRLAAQRLLVLPEGRRLPVEEGIHGGVEILVQEGELEELDAQLDVGPRHAVGHDAVFEEAAHGLRAAQAFGEHGVGHQHGDNLLHIERHVAREGACIGQTIGEDGVAGGDEAHGDADEMREVGAELQVVVARAARPGWVPPRCRACRTRDPRGPPAHCLPWLRRRR